MKDFSYITNSHPAYIENLYADFVKNPEAVDPDIRKFFEGFDFALSQSNGQKTAPAAGPAKLVEIGNLDKEFGVFQLIEAYRKKGHLIAKTNPIRERKDRRANLDLRYFGLDDGDLQTTFVAGKFIGLENATLETIVKHLKKCYAESTGVEIA
jgi:2-oxoglutarate dehydrogenase E1 component